ncbi:MAG: SPFH domain-containing protein [Candidatus Thorarchaeota archaeon]|nr:SPFH domain-containing protein [Candidatus Thorarchaeota archaeon]
MGEATDNISEKRNPRETRMSTYEYSGSPVPFVSFLFLAVIFLFLGIYGNQFGIPIGIGFESTLMTVLGGLFLILIPATLAINKQWQEAIILRFGKYKRLVGPGIFFKWPVIEKFLRQDLRIQTLDVSKQEVMTKDNISLMADAVVFMKVINTAKSLINIMDVKLSVVQYAQTTMRDVIGNVELDELLEKRDEIADRIKEIVDRISDDWGVDIISVNLQNIELPDDMKRVIARQAEAERERRAVIIKSEGELRAAHNLEAAVQQMSSQALYLRTLSSLEDISFDQSNTIVFAIPLDIVNGEIMGLAGLAGATRAAKETKQLRRLSGSEEK